MAANRTSSWANITHGAWLSSAKIKVDPEVMIAKANSVSQKINTIKNNFQALENKVNSTNSYWVGEANDTYREKYSLYKESIDQIIARLEEHVRDLNTMSGVYTSTEKEIESIIEELPVDVIS